MSKAVGGVAPNSTLRKNQNESDLLCYLGEDVISVKRVLKVGLYETKVLIRTERPKGDTEFQNELTIEDFEGLGNNKVIVANSLGLIEVFVYDAGSGNCMKLENYDLNDNETTLQPKEVVTCISLRKNEKYLAAATTINDHKRGKISLLKRIMIFMVKPDSKLEQVAFRDFGNTENSNSAYYYINFKFDFRDIPVIFAFQNEDQRRLDVYSYDEGRVNLIHRVLDYHSNYFTAIRDINDFIVSVDYDGVLKILEVPD